jgi:hypothetical protein
VCTEGDEIMKRVKGGTKVIRGQISASSYQNKIQLFDGKFTTGYRIVGFEFMPKDPQSGLEYLIKVSTKPKSNLAEFNWDDVEEVAWGIYNTPIASRFGTDVTIDPENMAIEDLYVSVYTTGESGHFMNYQLTLEKFEFTAWDGAATMVKNQSQSGPT